MISEPQEEQAALYALGMLDADEAMAFEHEVSDNPELADLVRQYKETAATLAHAPGISGAPSTGLRRRVLDGIASLAHPTADAKIIRPRFGWVPWAIAALLLGCATLLALDRSHLSGQLTEVKRLVGLPAPVDRDVLSQVAFCELEPTPDASVKPRAAVLWFPAEHKGVLRITRLTPPAEGKDYQLWAVEIARKEPVNAGVVHVDPDGHAEVAFRPESIPGDNKVVALAISLEQSGGSPTNQGPILFLGKL